VISAAALVEFNMAALLHNTQKAYEYAPNSKLIAVIKANAYGHGALKVAQILAPKVEGFAVARLDEALALRDSGIKKKILVLQGFSQANEIFIFQELQLDAVVHSEYQIELLEKSSVHGSLLVWLKIDTGMHRLGIHPVQFKALLARLRACCSVADDIKFMTHFSDADDRKDNKRKQQERCFLEAIKNEVGETSVANSAAIMAFPSSHHDWNRAGLMLYGASPILNESAQSLELKPVMTFSARVIAIKSLKKGDAVGYGGDWVAKKDFLMAVVSAGYGDGYPRNVQMKTMVLINGQRFPLVGRVSMDALTIDLNGSDDVVIGDKVILWGASLTVDEIAQKAGSIPYTLLCGITARVRVVWKS
jgi:alanine racemase